MKINYGLYFLFVLFIAPTSPVWGQDATCPALVQNALEATGNACEGIGRNQICYGHTTVELEPHDASVRLPFNAPGDFADVAEVQSIRLVSMDELFSEWGVALMKLQANIPDTLPGENVTFVLFGDVEIEAAAPTNVEPVTLTVTAFAATTVWDEPSTESEEMDTLAVGDQLVANGRNQAGDWLHVLLPNDQTGWVNVAEVVPDADSNLLDVVGYVPPPLSAFYLRTGIGDARCGEVPSSGLLIQTPKGLGSVHITINEVNIQLMSTVYVQAQPSGEMTLSVLEGQVQVEVDGAIQWLPQGAQIRIPLDANGGAAGGFELAEPYDDLTPLTPVLGLMPFEVAVQAPITDEALAAYWDRPLYSQDHGNACVPGGVTLRQTIYGKDAINGVPIVQVGTSFGVWTAKAGVTATFTVSGDMSQESTPRPESATGFIFLVPIDNTDTFFAQSSGTATTLTHTFTEEFTPFTLHVRTYVTEGEVDTITMTVTCETAP